MERPSFGPKSQATVSRGTVRLGSVSQYWKDLRSSTFPFGYVRSGCVVLSAVESNCGRTLSNPTLPSGADAVDVELKTPYQELSEFSRNLQRLIRGEVSEAALSGANL
jgi:hypothetical protein